MINNQQKPGVLSHLPSHRQSAVSTSRQMRPAQARMRNDRELVLRVILVDTMLGWAQTENDIFNLWVMMIMFIVLLVLHYLARIIGHVSQHPRTHVASWSVLSAVVRDGTQVELEANDEWALRRKRSLKRAV